MAPRNDFLNFTFPSLHTCTLSIIRTNRGQSSITNTYLSLLYCSVLSVITLRDESVKWKRLETWDDKQGTRFGECVPPKSKRCICFPFGSVHTTMDLDRLEEMISRDAGKNVKFLFLNNILVSQSCVIAFHSLLGVLTSLCENLTEINLAGTHNTFPDGRNHWFTTMLDTISSVHGLKRLVIPECCVCPLAYRQADKAHATVRSKRMKLDDPKFENDDNDYQRKASLLKLVEGCPCLVELDIRNEPKTITTDTPCNCDSPQDGLQDEDLFPILEMQKLEHLTLMGLKAVARMEFWKDLSVKCPSLKTLRLAGLGPQGMCAYWPSLGPALSTMSSLQELSIDHDKLPLDEESFWLDLGRIPFLVRLCIISRQFSGNLEPHHILDFVLSVPTIKTLHIHSLVINFRTCLAKLSRKLKHRKVDIQLDHLQFRHIASYDHTLYPGNFYECQRMCYKGSTVAILMDTCGRLHV